MKFPKAIFLALSIFFIGDLQAQVPNIDDPRLQIKLTDLSGDSVALSSFKGKVVLLDFWASWCGPCRTSNRKLTKVYKKYHPQGFEIFGVSLDERPEDWKRAVKTDKITWTQVIDPRGQRAESAIDWNVYAIPTSYLINRKGEVVAMGLEGKQLEKAIEKLLAE